MNDTTRFVTFPLGEERFALNSSQVKELLMPSRVYSFPHTMPALEGVLVRNGSAIPVCDLGRAFGHASQPSLYLVAQCNYAGRAETVAVPVSGDCELVQGQEIEATYRVPFGAGLLSTGDKTVPLLDLDRIVAHCIQPVFASDGETKS
jgi:chemotaxis signal transduction protein